MKLNSKGVQRVEDERIPYGVYVFRCEDGEYLGDGDGNLMLSFGLATDAKTHARKIIEAARHYGFYKGKVEFWRGQRPVSDEEFNEQMERAKWGLTPDPFDMSSVLDTLEARKQNGR
jgi:hypothetical protein